jgi:hypothetical protein
MMTPLLVPTHGDEDKSHIQRVRHSRSNTQEFLHPNAHLNLMVFRITFR